jgi:uncharacterized SAM-binding protein YcdF (DUF218 family)
MTAAVAFAKEFLHPSHIVFIVGLLVAGSALLLTRPTWGRRWLVTMTLAYWLLSIPVGTSLLGWPLARGFHPIADQREAEGAGAIVVLGGGIDWVTVGANTIEHLSTPSALRAIEGVRLFRLLDWHPLVVASGGRPTPGPHRGEGAVMADALVALGVPRERILVEDRSLTTHDEAQIVTEMLAARGIRRFVLVTSPTHMTRSVAVFRAQGADVVPSAAPVRGDAEHRLPWFVPTDESMGLSDSAIYDYAATTYYWLHGWLRQPAGRP